MTLSHAGLELGDGAGICVLATIAVAIVVA
jgi:hypothetical protein